MNEPTPTRRSAGELFRGVCLLLSLAFGVMWLSSYAFYTSFGVDVDRAEGAIVIQTHYRLRWPGNGAFFIGGDAFKRPHTGTLEPFDVGGAFFQAPRRPPMRSPWNRLGFWLIDRTSGEAMTQAPASSFWLGVPSWLPPLLLGLAPLLGWLRRKRRAP